MTVYRDKMQTIEFEVSDYKFDSFEPNKNVVNGAKDFEFINFDKDSPLKKEEHQRVIKAERGAAVKNHFEISSIVKEHRGLVDQEDAEREARIQEEVESRVKAISQKAFEEGRQEGVEQGRSEIIEQTKHEVEDKLNHLSLMVDRVLEVESQMLEKHKKDIYTVTKSLTKWVILRELKDDDNYLYRLLEKIILEINSKANLLIKVGRHNFDGMPEVLEQVEASLGKIKNVRLELDDDLDSKGLVVESDNGIINASFKQQLKSISDLFETLGVSDEKEDEVSADDE